ncbi:MAG: tRNA-His guanylyltransferase [Caeruleum heppii]|nr:MAG: tRNA-His guanylyltransferase [Caeruleum heppii]
MANSKYEYVRQFEQPDVLLPNTWIVVRIDGRGFHKLSNKYEFEKPNDRRALNLMNAAAVAVLEAFVDVGIAYGVSDEFSFIFQRSTTLFDRRASKLLSTFVSTFTATYTHLWPSHFSSTPLSSSMLPTFDARAIMLPSWGNVRDYLAWRQVDCHINNLYNTTFWALVQKGGLTAQEAEQELAGTLSADKNEILFKRFDINYNNEDEMFKKGSVVFRDYPSTTKPHTGDTTPSSLPQPSTHPESTAIPSVPQSKTQFEAEKTRRRRAGIVIRHVDIIGEGFWVGRGGMLGE